MHYKHTYLETQEFIFIVSYKIYYKIVQIEIFFFGTFLRKTRGIRIKFDTKKLKQKTNYICTHIVDFINLFL